MRQKSSMVIGSTYMCFCFELVVIHAWTLDTYILQSPFAIPLLRAYLFFFILSFFLCFVSFDVPSVDFVCGFICACACAFAFIFLLFHRSVKNIKYAVTHLNNKHLSTVVMTTRRLFPVYT